MKTTSLLTRTLAGRRPTGFTLMELMLVLGIIGLLVAAGVKMGPAVGRYAKNGSAKTGIATLEGFLTGKKITPNTFKDMINKGIISESMATDPWDHPYIFQVPARRALQDKKQFDLYSQGANVEDEGDDIGNWETD
jgi:prepilin-type N-terminal cleavage/methylation domain-containing protein